MTATGFRALRRACLVENRAMKRAEIEAIAEMCLRLGNIRDVERASGPNFKYNEAIKEEIDRVCVDLDIEE